MTGEVYVYGGVLIMVEHCMGDFGCQDYATRKGSGGIHVICCCYDVL